MAECPRCESPFHGLPCPRETDARADALAADGTEPHPAHRHDETETGRG